MTKAFEIAISCLYEWQTLVSGLIALFAAYMGWRAIRNQIAQAEVQFVQTRNQRFSAERAALAHTLTQVSKYADSCLSQTSTILGKMFDPTGSNNRTKVLTGMLPTYDPPALGSEAVSELKTCLEFAPEAFGKLVASLIIDLQVQQSRIQSLWDDVKHSENTIITRHNIDSAFLDAATIKAHAANLYQYARFQTYNIPHPIEWEIVENAIAHYSGGHLGTTFELLRLRRQEDDRPHLIRVDDSSTLES